MSKNVECVKVVVRCRPLSSTEQRDNREVIIQIDTKRGEIQIKNLKAESGEKFKSFTFDYVYDWNSKQEQVYKDVAFPIVESVLEGYNGTIFAYGQTGTGKTYTMEGIHDKDELKGIIPRAFAHIFQVISSASKNKQFLVKAQFLELYNEEVRDLLSKSQKKLEIREKPESGIYVKDLSSFLIENMEELSHKLQIGTDNRHTGQTLMNDKSSRSHSVFTVTIEQKETVDNQSTIRVGKLNLVDLAGSERQSKTGAQGDRFKEAVNINLSLTTLGNVISALVDAKQKHVPYRDSKLTRLLQDSLGGNTKTVMVANLGPADYNADESLSTLRYANRAKNIQNKPKINEDPKDALLRQYQDEIEKLKQQLADGISGDDISNLGGQATIIQKKKIIKIQDDAKLKEIQKNLEKEKKEIFEQTEKEKQRILEQKNIADKEKEKLLSQLEERESVQQQQKEEKMKLCDKIKKMQKKLMQGKEAKEKALENERRLQKAKEEIEKKKILEKQIEEEQKAREEQTVQLKDKYSSKKEEVEQKTKAIKILWSKLKKLDAENKEIDEFYSKEIDELENRRRELILDLKLKNLIVEYFIPEKQLETLESRAWYNDEIENWIIPNLNLACNSSEAQRLNSSKDKIKGKSKNNFDYLLEQEDDIEQVEMLKLEEHPNVYFVYTEDGVQRQEEYEQQRQMLNNGKVKANKKTAAKKKKTNKQSEPKEEQYYPQARGLIKQ